jgi:hypothetical protein
MAGDRRCIFAWTAAGANYPEYIAVDMQDGKLKITVRSAVRGAGTYTNSASFAVPGLSGTLTLPKDQVPALIKALSEVASG